jgi:phosphatidylinositol alpha-1,6-mannosyltransferase
MRSALKWLHATTLRSGEGEMIVSPERRQFLVLTPSIGGADGLSALSRQVVRALTVDRERRVPAVEVWALDGGGLREPHASARVRVRLAGGRRSTFLSWTLARAVKPLGDVLVIVMHAHLAPLASILALRGAETALFLVGVEVWRRLRPAERFAFERADRIVAISDHTTRRFRAANPDVRVRSISVCRPGIASMPQLASPQSRRGFALIVGRMWSEERYKGHDWLIDVWPAVRERVPVATLVVAGGGDDRARLEDRVAAAGLKDAIQFTGPVDDDTLAGLYRACAFFVMPSSGEGFGLTYLEAMRAGKPCIAVHGAADEIIRDGIDGMIVGAEDSDGLVEAAARLFLDVSWRERLGAAAAARVSSEFSEEASAARLRAALGLSAPVPSDASSRRPAHSRRAAG